jgi:hypothetical protein
LRYDALVKAQAPVLIALRFHVPTWYHTTRLCAKTARKEEPITKTRKSPLWFSFVPSSFRAFVVQSWFVTIGQLGACSGIPGEIE